MAEKVVAERAFSFHDQPGRTATVQIFQPEQTEEGWICKVAFAGFGYKADPYIRESRADDSAGALLLAVETVAHEVGKFDSLRIAGDSDRNERGELRNPWHIRAGAYWLPMPLPLPGEVVLERVLAVAAGDSRRTARIVVFKPEPEGSGHWMCRYMISDLRKAGDIIKSHACGSDSVQALYLAMYSIGVDIEAAQGTSWLDGRPWYDFRVDV